MSLASSLETSQSDLASLAALGDDYVFEHLHGRTFSRQRKLYHLPADVAEHERLDLQHMVWKLTLDGLYPAKEAVQYALRKEQPGVPSVMDIGTGNGRWAVQMAEEYPHCEILGGDLVVPTRIRSEKVPENCRFEIINANDPMDYYTQAFNVIHCRSAETGINDFEAWLFKIANALRPSGVLLLGAMPGLVDESGKPHTRKALGDPRFSWVEYIFSASTSYLHSQRNFGLESNSKWTEWLKRNPNFQDVITKSYMVPIGPWKPGMSDKEVEAATYLRDDIIQVFESFKPLLRAMGWDTAAVEQATVKARKELEDQEVHHYFRLLATSAVRTTGQWQAQQR